jgi:hypothetical protein
METESHSLTTESSRRPLERKESSALKISSTKSTPLEPTSRKPTTSSGPSSLAHPEEDSMSRDILS